MDAVFSTVRFTASLRTDYFFAGTGSLDSTSPLKRSSTISISVLTNSTPTPTEKTNVNATAIVRSLNTMLLPYVLF